MESRKWTVWTSLSTLAIVAVMVAASVVGASTTVQLRNSIAGTGCEDLGEYLFILNGLSGSDTPASIQVVLSGGGSITVARSKLNNRNAHYSLAEGDVPGGQVPVNAFAVVPDGFTGNFVISHVPCAAPSPSPSPEPSPSPSPEPSPQPSPSPGL